MADLRPIHYLGNKSQFLAAIEAVVDDVARPSAAACDLFAGTAVVTRRLARTRPVVSADVQAYSPILARALTRPRVFSAPQIAQILGLAREWLASVTSGMSGLLELEERALSDPDPGHLAQLIEHGSLAVNELAPFEDAKAAARTRLDRRRATLTWYYGGVYFSYRQALELDALRNALRVHGGDRRDDTAVAALLGVASDTVSTVGNHFAQPIQPWRADGAVKRNWVTAVIRSRRIQVFDRYPTWLSRYAVLPPTAHPCRAQQTDHQRTLTSLGREVGVVYADPPYTRDHYSRFYHVLETIAVDDDPGVTWNAGKPGRGLYRLDRHQSPFSIKSQVRPAFRELFGRVKGLGIPLVLSYSPMSGGTRARPRTRLLSIDELTRMAREYFGDVRLLEIADAAHSRFNRVELNAAVDGTAEILLVAGN